MTNKEKQWFDAEDMAKLSHGDGRSQAMALLLECGVYEKLREVEKQCSVDGLSTIHYIDAVLGLALTVCFSMVKRDDMFDRAMGTAAMVDFIRTQTLRVAKVNMEVEGEPKKQT